MKEIRLAFSGVWFNPVDDPKQDILRVLKETGVSYKVVEENPDFVIYGPVGKGHLRYECPRIYITGENQSPNFRECDYAIGFDYIDYGDRYIRYPLYQFYTDDILSMLNRNINIDESLWDRKFCAFVISNPQGDVRNSIIQKISNIGAMDSGGKYLNNVGGPVDNKVEFLKDYKFSIAMENSSYPGYVTEKIVESFAARTIPIYWGDPLVTRTFNPKAFINLNDYPSIEEAAQYINYINRNKSAYMKMMKEPALINNDLNLRRTELVEFFRYIFLQDKDKAYRRNRSERMDMMDKIELENSLSLKEKIWKKIKT